MFIRKEEFEELKNEIKLLKDNLLNLNNKLLFSVKTNRRFFNGYGYENICEYITVKEVVDKILNHLELELKYIKGNEDKIEINNLKEGASVNNIENKTSAQVTTSQPKFDGKKWVQSIFIEDIIGQGPIYRTMKGK